MREVVTIEQLREAATWARPNGTDPGSRTIAIVPRPAGDFDLAAWLEEHGVPVGTPRPWNGYQRWEITPCWFNPDHAQGEAWVGQRASGAIVAGCQHDSCAWEWSDLREHYEPGYRDRRSGDEWNRELRELVGEKPAEQPTDGTTSPPSSTPRLLVVRYVTDAIKAPPPEPPVLIDGFLRTGELAVVGAPRAIGKSWLAKQIGYLLAQGEGHLCGTLAVQRRARVLIAQGELDPWGSYRRWKLLTGNGTPPDGVAETFDRWRIQIRRLRSTNRDDTGSWSEEWIDAVLDRRIETTIAEHRFNVLIIDPWAVYYSGSENSNDETEAALDKLRDLALRYGVTIVIFCHLGKATEAREAEDLWRGASRLADWASTRVTLLPHYTEAQRIAQGMTRAQARRYVDVKLLRRSDPTEDFSMALNWETGWWEHWNNPVDVAEDRRITLNPIDVAEACRADGGNWPSVLAAAVALGKSQTTTRRLLDQTVRAGFLEAYDGPRHARGHRVPGGFSDGGTALDLRDPYPPETTP